MVLASLVLVLDVASLIRDLDHDEYEVRKEAFDALVRTGKAALPALHEAVKDGPSLEVRDASRRILDAVLTRVREDFIAEHSAKPKNFACGGLSFYSRNEATQRAKGFDEWFPECEILVGWYGCMHRVQLCGGTWVIGLSRKDGEMFTIVKRVGRRQEAVPGDAAVLARYLRPARDEADAADLKRLLE